MDETPTATLPSTLERVSPSGWRIGLVILWSRSEPERCGEVLLCPAEGPGIVGRGLGSDRDTAPRILPVRQRPGQTEPTGALEDRSLSRLHWVLTAEADHTRLRLEHHGRHPTHVDGAAVQAATLEPGASVSIPGVLLARVVRRQLPLPALRPGLALPPHPFGRPDGFGLVGESPAAWALRERLAFVAGREGHVLILGPSGVGKEIAARAIHGLSRRAGGPWVARDAGTLPGEDVNGLLFGRAATRADGEADGRGGLVQRARGGTLFLDEIAELPHEVQAGLLRVLDGGDLPLGPATREPADLRIVAATRQPLSALGRELAHRFLHRVDIPSLDERAEDIPLIARHLFTVAAAEDPVLGRFMDDGRPRLGPELVRVLVERPRDGQVRAIRRTLIETAAQATGDRLEGLPSPEIAAEVAAEGEGERTRVATSPTPPEDGPRFRIALDGSHLEVDGRMVDLRRRRAVRRLLAALAGHRRDQPGAPLPSEACIEAGWPDERILPDAARARLWSAIKVLRDLGLAPVLETVGEGYRLASPVEIVEPH